MEEKLLKWQKEVVDRISGYSNEELLTEILSLAGGDSYDGCFTNRGEWEFQYMEKVLRERLYYWLKK